MYFVQEQVTTMGISSIDLYKGYILNMKEGTVFQSKSVTLKFRQLKLTPTQQIP